MPLVIYFLLVWLLTVILCGEIFGAGGPPMGPDFGGSLEDLCEQPEIDDSNQSVTSEDSNASSANSENGKPIKYSKGQIVIRVLYGLLIVGPMLIGSGTVLISLLS